MTTKVRIEDVTIETTGELERDLIKRAFEYLALRHSGTIMATLTKEEVEAVREALNAGVETGTDSKRDIDSIIEDFAKRHAEADIKVTRPRQYPKVGVDGQRIDGTRTGATIGEMLATNGQIPEHWVTGIKRDEDGIPWYKAHYWCPCGNEGNRYIQPGWAFLKCHKCDARLKVEPATHNGFPDRDIWGNYFVARELFDGNAEAVETTDEPDISTSNETPNDAVEEAQVDG